MKLTPFLLALFGLFALCGVPGAHAQTYPYGCKDADCAMAHGIKAMTEQSAQADAERQRAADAARAVVGARNTGSPVVVAPDIPQPQRAILAYKVEDMLEQASHKATYVVSAELFQYTVGGGFLVCGSAIYDGGNDKGIFVVDLRSGGSTIFKADAVAYGRAGCGGKGTILR